ncbi:MAG: Glutathione import ATP-binding protein GsiA [Deltaproteobacteria bacterium]|jgi:peptide/nickel transport system ATP-binding protein|nr:Glutathione import ATP-binding protein GsiA [Deltaproteobacteria bacterium]
MQPVLKIDNLSVQLPKGADRQHAVENVRLEVLPREILCIVGESGSGKSVTGLSVMGLLPKGQLKPVSGKILLQDENLLEASEERLRDLRCTGMSMIFQEPMTALNPVMRCGDQIDEVLSTHTKLEQKERTQRIIRIMEEVRLPEPERLINAYPHQLSGGQRQRIMIAMALVLEPVLLIADEPTTALDVTTQSSILQLIRDIQHDHQTGVLFITHDFGVVAEIADRVAVMQWGKVVEFGEARQILSDPQHDYTRMLIGAVPSMKPGHREREESSQVVLNTEKLSKTYSERSLFRTTRTVYAAQQVDIEVRRGETLGIVGESGSGKTTVARCIVRLIDPTSGEVFLDGNEIGQLRTGQLRPYRKRIQIIFQDPYRSLNPRRIVGDSIIEGATNYGISREDALKRAHSLMELVQLDPNSLDRFPHQFSGGQRQRICIARALTMEPEVLIADEAVSALDVSVQAQVLKLLDDVRRRFNLALLFITHDLRVAAQICDTVAVMSQSKVVEYGLTHDVFSNPRHEYTRSLLDAAPGKDWEFDLSLNTHG